VDPDPYTNPDPDPYTNSDPDPVNQMLRIKAELFVDDPSFILTFCIKNDKKSSLYNIEANNGNRKKFYGM